MPREIVRINVASKFQIEPPRVFRRLFRLSHAAIAGLASMA